MLQYKCPKCGGLLVSNLSWNAGNVVLIYQCTVCDYNTGKNTGYTTSNTTDIGDHKDE